MTTTTKAANYTVEQTAELVSRYVAGETVESLAVAMGRTTRSLIAKLSREGYYKAKERVSKTGEAIVKKDALSDQLAALCGLSESEADSLTKANKTALAKILNCVKESKLSKDMVS